MWLCGLCKVRQRGPGSGWEGSWAAVLPGPGPWPHQAGLGFGLVQGTNYAPRTLLRDGPEVFRWSLVCSGQTDAFWTN